MCFLVVGLMPTRHAVVEWQDSAECCGGDPSPGHFTFELILNEADRSLDFVYQTLTYQTGTNHSFYVGLQDALGTSATNYVFSAATPPTTIAVGTSLHAVPNP